MCEFISYIEKNGEVLFLTGDDVFNTKRGKQLQKHCKSADDLTGHGAIRWYFGIDDKPLEGGKERECTDFSSPANFPKPIVKAIKAGLMAGFKDGTPQELLTNTARAEYDKITNPARAEYLKITNPALAEYDKIKNTARAEYDKIKNTAWAEYEKITNTAWAEYDKITNTARAEYNKITNTARAEYNKITNPALAEYEKITNTAFWALFADVNNRNHEWR
jgi:cell division septum initiation protein DivIVA